MSLVSDQEWEEYKSKFNKVYTDAQEDNMRRERFVKSKQTVEEHNKKYENGEVTWKMAINHLSDLTEEEYAKRCGKKVTPPTST
ncbi:PREDICTED: digestive cysteine proteinase 2 [Rhagoletis zephyria]|uniref:digestive cysteine proteinase 2 n=1 Tax=Rhagoletis zephyria TaxID=28612 RepID=UPI0008119E43|nr:PREDICTED: digestive cysteine proteinase 2 [Rhagoletis zephyria]